MMTKIAMTEAIILAKQSKQTTWSEIAQVAGLSEVYTTSACLGMNHLDKDAADKLVDPEQRHFFTPPTFITFKH